MAEFKKTPKMELAIKAVQEMEGDAFARDVLNYLDANYADRTELKTFNQVNATLAHLVRAGLATKTKSTREDKIATKYALVEE